MVEFYSQIFTGVLLGLYVGVVPVFLGFFFLPILQRLSIQWRTFVISISIGVLLFLFVDVTAEAIELSEKLIAGLLVPADGKAVVPAFDNWLFNTLGQEISEHLGEFILILGFVIGVGSLIWIDSWIKEKDESEESQMDNPSLESTTFSQANILSLLGINKLPSGFSVAFLIALGIGLHNLGEGLAVGVSLGTGNTTLATALIFGFAIHNVTEGVAITGPISNTRVSIGILFILGMIAGLPTIIGSWIGLLVFSNAISVFFFSIAAGSLLYVVVNIIASLGEDFKKSNWNYVAILLGVFIMYLTSLLIII